MVFELVYQAAPAVNMPSFALSAGLVTPPPI